MMMFFLRNIIQTLFTVVQFVGGGYAVAPSDSLTLVSAPWQVDTLDGMVLKTVHFSHQEYFQSNQYMGVLEIPAGADYGLSFAYEPRRTPTTTIAQRHHAVAAINGSFFDMDKHNPICFLRIDGKEVSENVAGKDTLHRKYYQYGTLALTPRPCIVRTDSLRNWERCLSYPDIMTAGPLLIYHDSVQAMRDDLSFVYKRHNRSAVGIRPDGTVLLFVVDGRTKESEGMSLDELIKTMKWLGCCDALNLDGGGSTTLYVQGLPHNGVVNHPSDNGNFDRKGERAVSNAILVLSKKD